MAKLSSNLRRGVIVAFTAASVFSAFGVVGVQASEKQDAYFQHVRECIHMFWTDLPAYEANCTPAIDPGGSIYTLQGFGAPHPKEECGCWWECNREKAVD